jgi:hypothetical protein
MATPAFFLPDVPAEHTEEVFERLAKLGLNPELGG